MIHRFGTKITFLPLAFAVALTLGGGTVASVALGTIPAALAQDAPAGPPPAGGGHKRMGQILMTLNLNDAQKAQIHAIFADARKHNKDVTDRDIRRANMRAAVGKVDAVLTPAQRTQWHAKIDALRQQQTDAAH